ncbi:MAG: NmrA family NAD(P)-binding protein [Armatimonadota bacterium]|nr:NmrA family NAD(P)-binding protein [Armatimonadota bacterium]
MGKVLVIGGTGTVGAEVVRGLLDRGADVRAMARGDTAVFPSGVEIVRGDLARPETLAAPLSGVDGVFLVVPDGPDVVSMGLGAVEAAKAAGARRIVYISVARTDLGAEVPGLGGKVPIEQAIRESGIPHTILQPNNFYQNDRFFRREIVELGIYPQPLGNVGINRVDVRDIADATVNALLGSGCENKTCSLHGPEALTGERAAEIYSRVLGRKVRYIGESLDEWEPSVGTPEWMVEDFPAMSDYFKDHGLRATSEELAAQREVVGHPARDFKSFAAELIEVFLDHVY